MFKQWIEVLHEHDNGYLDWFPGGTSTSFIRGCVATGLEN